MQTGSMAPFDPGPRPVKRILVYTHNSIGLGHAFRMLAVISGMRKWRPDIDFLVMSGTSVPHIFLREGIEVIKLPAIKLELEEEDHPLRPRYLSGFPLESVFDFRQRIILDGFDFFNPDVLMVEHNMAGLMSEVIPILLKKRLRQGGQREFAVVHISRGIMRRAPLIHVPYPNPIHGSDSINLSDLYDHLYVMEDRAVVDVNQEYFGGQPDLDRKIKYLGRITNKLREELPSAEHVLDRFGLAGRKIILLVLGRHGGVFELSRRLLTDLEKTGLKSRYQVIMVIDPYLDSEAALALRNDPLAERVLVLPFIPNLIDLIHSAELVICRAGYNTINELLLTDTRALVIPESHPSGEQERRVAAIPKDNLAVASDADILRHGAAKVLLELINRPITPLSFSFDKYAIGKIILDDLGQWMSRNGTSKTRPPDEGLE